SESPPPGGTGNCSQDRILTRRKAYSVSFCWETGKDASIQSVREGNGESPEQTDSPWPSGAALVFACSITSFRTHEYSRDEPFKRPVSRYCANSGRRTVSTAWLVSSAIFS